MKPTVPSMISSLRCVRLLRFCAHDRDRKSTRLNSSHGYISYAVFCLKKKKNLSETTDVPACNTPSKHTYPTTALAPNTNLLLASSGIEPYAPILSHLHQQLHLPPIR